MNPIWIVVALSCLALLAAMVALLRRFRRTPDAGLRPDLASISAARYRPMARLLDPAEEAFVASRLDRAAVGRFRADRRRVFRGYLRSLERDFGGLCAAVRLLLAHSEQDRPELAAALMRREAGFAFAVFSVRCRLLLHAAGIGTVDVRRLVAALDDVRSELGGLLPAASAA